MDVRFGNDIFLFAKNSGMSICFLFLGHAGKHGQGNLPNGESPKLSFSEKIVNQHSSTSLKAWTTCP